MPCTFTKTIQKIIINFSFIVAGLANTTLASPTQTITLSGFANLPSPPFAWVDDCNQKITGSSQHILHKAFEEHNAKLIIDQPLAPFSNQWHEQARKLIRGDLDLFLTTNMDIYHTDKNIIIHNSKPAIVIDSGFISVKNNEPKLTSLEQAKGKKVGLATNLQAFITATGLSQETFSNIDIKDKLTTEDAINRLIAGEFDYLIGGRFRYNLIALKMNKNTRLKFHPVPKLSRNLYFWHHADNKNTALFDAVLTTLESYRESGYIEHMNKSYFMSWKDNPDCETATSKNL